MDNTTNMVKWSITKLEDLGYHVHEGQDGTYLVVDPEGYGKEMEVDELAKLAIEIAELL